MSDFNVMGDASTVVRRRQQRGTERRQALISATLRIIEAEGLEGVTHRRVAESAGVALAATTYYFSSKEDLMQAAMETQIAHSTVQLRAIAEAVTERGSMTLEEGVEALISRQSELLSGRRMELFAEFELYLRVARTAPRPDDLPAWPEAFFEVAVAALRALGAQDAEREGRTLVALIHGMTLHALVSKDPDYAQNIIAPALRRWFEQVVPVTAR